MLKVIGLGNILRGDDGVGPLIIDKLQKSSRSLPIKLYNVGSDAFSILEHLLGEDPIVIIDCARMGKNPGTVQKIVADDTDLLPSNFGISLHGFSLADIWQIARSMGSDGKLAIIGVEPERINFNSGLSKVVKKSIPIIIKIIAEEASKYEKKDSHH
jgi:hydrogenase maturation protease